MTISEIIAKVDELRPNHYSREIKIGWLNEIEHKAVDSVFNKALFNNIEFVPFSVVDDDRELLIPDVHTDVYETYLYAKMDYANMEMDRYNADAMMHQACWSDWASEYRRNHYPKPVSRTVPKYEAQNETTIH